jgi:hypothetical protein
LVDALPEDALVLTEVDEVLRLNRELSEAFDDLKNGRTLSPHELLAKIEERWPRANTVSCSPRASGEILKRL